MPPLTVALIAARTAARAGSTCLCRSIAARNSVVGEVLGDAQVGEGVDVGGLEPVVPRVQVRAGLAAQVRLDRGDVVAKLLGVGDGVRLVPGRARRAARRSG